jgi:nucleoside-diphosphate-sugar epimerase
MKEKLILTGASSFVGHHLAIDLSEKYDVIATSSKSISEYEGVSRKRLNELANKVTYESWNIKDEKRGQELLDKHKPAFFIHHAGYTQNYGSDEYDLNLAHEINVKPLYWLVPELKKGNVRGLLVTGTSMEYPGADSAISEATVLAPDTKYGQSKYMESLTALGLGVKHDLPVRVARIFNPIGKYENPRKLFPFLIDSLKDGKKVDLSPCEQVRNFHHVNLVTAAYKALLIDLKNGGADVFNIVHPENWSLKEVLLQAAKHLNASPELLNFGAKPMRAGEPLALLGDGAKLASIMTYQHSLQSDINRIVDDLVGSKD